MQSVQNSSYLLLFLLQKPVFKNMAHILLINAAVCTTRTKDTVDKACKNPHSVLIWLKFGIFGVLC